MARSTEFREPIELPDGLTFRTLRDAATYILKLPKADQNAKEWQAAMECLISVAEKNGPTMSARIGVMLALNRNVERVFNPDRQTRTWGANGSWSGINNSPLKAMRQNIAFLNATLRTNVNNKKKRQVHSHMRFEAFLDPMNNWVVWDTKEQYFAEVGTRYLLSLPEERAKAFCTMLNILFSKNDPGDPASV